MKLVTPLVFHAFHFPHQGKIVTINQLDYCTPDLRANANPNVLFVSDSCGGYASISAGPFKDSLLLGTFRVPLPNYYHVALINMISSIGRSSSSYDPWVIHDLHMLIILELLRHYYQLSCLILRYIQHQITLTWVSHGMWNLIRRLIFLRLCN